MSGKIVFVASDWTLTPPKLVFAVASLVPAASLVPGLMVDSASAIAPFTVSAVAVALAVPVGGGRKGPPSRLGKPADATAVAIAFPPPVADASAVAVALPGEGGRPENVGNTLSPAEPPAAFAEDDASPAPLVLALLLALAFPPTPPSVSEKPPEPPFAVAEAVALPVPEVAPAPAIADPPSPPPRSGASSMLPPEPPDPPEELAFASAVPEMVVVVAAAPASPPPPPMAPAKPWLGLKSLISPSVPPTPPLPPIAVASFGDTPPAIAVTDAPSPPGWPTSPGLTPSAPFAPAAPWTVTSSAYTPAALAVIRAKDSPVVCNSRIKNER